MIVVASALQYSPKNAWMAIPLQSYAIFIHTQQ